MLRIPGDMRPSLSSLTSIKDFSSTDSWSFRVEKILEAVEINSDLLSILIGNKTEPHTKLKLKLVCVSWIETKSSDNALGLLPHPTPAPQLLSSCDFVWQGLLPIPCPFFFFLNLTHFHTGSWTITYSWQTDFLRSFTIWCFNLKQKQTEQNYSVS